MYQKVLLFLCFISFGSADQPLCTRNINMNKELDICVKTLTQTLVPTSSNSTANVTGGTTQSNQRILKIANCTTLTNLIQIGKRNEINDSFCSNALETHNENIKAFVEYFSFVFSEEKIKEYLAIKKDCLRQAVQQMYGCMNTTLRSDTNATFGFLRKPTFSNTTCFEARGISTIQSCVAKTLSACPNNTGQYVDSLFNKSLAVCQKVEQFKSKNKEKLQGVGQSPPNNMNMALKIVLIILSLVVFAALVFYLVRWFRLRPKTQENNEQINLNDISKRPQRS